MKISVIDRTNSVTDHDREYAVNRLRFALDRFARRIRKVSAVIQDESRAERSIEKRCKVSVTLMGGPTIVITETDSSVGACVAKAADRVGQSVSKAISRRRSFSRIRATDVPRHVAMS